MTKRVLLCSLALAALLAGCTTGPLQRGGDGMYLSTPAHPAAAPGTGSSTASSGD